MNQRLCEICGGSLAHRGPTARVCSPACTREKKRRYDHAYQKTRPAHPEPCVRTKHCPGCCQPGQVLPASDFGHNRNSASGLQSYCLKCRQAYALRPDQQRQAREYKEGWYKRNRQRLLERARRRYWTEPGRREAHIAYSRRHYWTAPGVRERQMYLCRVRYQQQRQRERSGVLRTCACGKRFAPRHEHQWFHSDACFRQTQRTVAVQMATALGKAA